METIAQNQVVKGSGSSNTLPQNSQSNLIDSVGVRCWGSEDTLVLNIYGEIGSSSAEHESFINLLEAEKTACKESGEALRVFQYRGHSYGIRFHGVRAGGQSGISMPYVLEAAGLVVLFTKQRYPSGNSFNCRVLVGSEILMERGGVEGVYPAIMATLEALGVRVLDEVISRIDACVDLPDSVSVFVDAFLSGAVVTRFKDDHLHRSGGRWSGISFGKGAIVLRIYDKLREVEVKRAESKLAILQETRFAALDGGHITRVEWQLRREQLKKWDIQTVSDWVLKAGGVLEYLMFDHTRFLDETPDRTHTSRYKPSALWARCISAFRHAFAEGHARPALKPREYFGGAIQALVKQAVGCISTALAMDRHGLPVDENDPVFTRSGWLREFAALVSREALEVDIPDRIAGRMLDLFAVARSRSPYFSADGIQGLQVT